VERAVSLARTLHIETRELEGEDRAAALVEFARTHKVTHIFVRTAEVFGLRWFTGRNLVHRIVDLAKEMEVIVVADRRSGKYWWTAIRAGTTPSPCSCCSPSPTAPMYSA